MKEQLLTIDGHTIDAYERIGHIDNTVLWAFLLDDGRLVTLTATELGALVASEADTEDDEDGDDFFDYPPVEKQISIFGVIGLATAAWGAIALVGGAWAVRVGLI